MVQQATVSVKEHRNSIKVLHEYHSPLPDYLTSCPKPSPFCERILEDLGVVGKQAYSIINRKLSQRSSGASRSMDDLNIAKYDRCYLPYSEDGVEANSTQASGHSPELASIIT